MSIVTLANMRRGIEIGSQPKKSTLNQGYSTSNMEESQENSQNMSELMYTMKTTYESGEMEHGILKIKEKLTGLDASELDTDFTKKDTVSSGSAIEQLVDARNKDKVDAPYSYLAKDGENFIEYNGVLFTLDPERKGICLGDMSNPDDIITIPLTGFGSLYLNRNNIGELSRAIDMFSPEDINRILDAISLDTKVQKMKNEVEDLKTKGVKSTEAVKTSEES